jgi:hypothetical protein
VKLLQINPAAVYISLMRNSLLLSARETWPGSKPFDAAKCQLFVNHKELFPYDNVYCHGYMSPHWFWAVGTGWAVIALVAGFYLFWRAEERYGRG